MNPRIIIAGGGTGGHIFPAVAIARALLRVHPAAELLFVGARGRMEMEKIPQEGFRIIGLDIAGFNRSSLFKNIGLPVKLLKSALKARQIVREFRPDAVVGVGGFASFPVLNAAQRMGIPTIIQEQNSFAGKANKILAKRASAICTAYEGMERFFPANKIFLTGNPVRATISHATVPQSEALAYFSLRPGKKTVLVVGGSLGAKSINDAIAANLASLAASGVQLIWQTGKPSFEDSKKAARPYSSTIMALDFIREMEKGYAAADIVVSRAGALAIAELCIAAKPVVFVPYPFAAEDHQTSNAMALVQRGAAQIVRDDQAMTGLVPALLTLIADPGKQAEMSVAIRPLAITDADARIASIILSKISRLSPGIQSAQVL